MDTMRFDNVETGGFGWRVTGEIAPDAVLTEEVDGYQIIITCRPSSVIDPIVASYDPESASSPNAADSRTIARPIVSHLAGYDASGGQ